VPPSTPVETIDASLSTETWTYAYDDAGNLTAKSDIDSSTHPTQVASAGSGSYTYNAGEVSCSRLRC
jgi:YD repeat-containing protein